MPSALKKEIKMRKTILTILGSALLAASTVQIAAAAEHHQARKVVRAPVTSTERARNANAYAWPPRPHSRNTKSAELRITKVAGFRHRPGAEGLFSNSQGLRRCAGTLIRGHGMARA
jgi:hypothetical protein